MRAFANRLATTFSRKRTVAIADCVHFCAYRYGRDETNPYEQYAKGLAEGLPLPEIRERFVQYVRGYRPRLLGEALGVALSKPYPLWFLPWRTLEQVSRSPGLCGSARSVIDVMTHFSDEGIPRSVVENEFKWHENAFASIAKFGYEPQRYRYISARELKGGRSAFLVTDGNHRLSAISALGGKAVVLKLPLGTTVIRDMVDQWALVKTALMPRSDALAVFDAYFAGNVSPARSEQLARVID